MDKPLTLKDLETMEGRTSAVVQNNKLFDGLVGAWMPDRNMRMVQVYPARGQPIETAPKDGRKIQLFMQDEWTYGYWSSKNECWYSCDQTRTREQDTNNQPTAWEPL